MKFAASKVKNELVDIDYIRRHSECCYEPTLAGIYFLLHAGRVVYVGQSARNPRDRILTHLHRSIVFSEYTIVHYNRAHIYVWEEFYINAFAPKYNISIGNGRISTLLCSDYERAGQNRHVRLNDGKLGIVMGGSLFQCPTYEQLQLRIEQIEAGTPIAFPSSDSYYISPYSYSPKWTRENSGKQLHAANLSLDVDENLSLLSQHFRVPIR